MDLVGVRIPVDGDELRARVDAQLALIVVLEEDPRNSRDVYRIITKTHSKCKPS